MITNPFIARFLCKSGRNVSSAHVRDACSRYIECIDIFSSWHVKTCRAVNACNVFCVIWICNFIVKRKLFQRTRFDGSFSIERYRSRYRNTKRHISSADSFVVRLVMRNTVIKNIIICIYVIYFVLQYFLK